MASSSICEPTTCPTSPRGSWSQNRGSDAPATPAGNPGTRAATLDDAFIRLGDTIANHIDAILITLEHRLSDAVVDAVNTRIRLLTRRAFGFHSSKPLIALAMLSFGGYRPVLPGRAA